MITLYHCAAARSFRPLWTLEELGLPYELKMLPFPPRVLAKEYLALNPLGTVPLLLDGEVRMTESAAIAQYLVTRYGPTPLAVGVEEPDYGAFLNWLHFGEATLTFPQTLVLRYTGSNRKQRRNPQVAADYAKWFLGRLRGVEAAIVQSDTLCARPLHRGRYLGRICAAAGRQPRPFQRFWSRRCGLLAAAANARWFSPGDRGGESRRYRAGSGTAFAGGAVVSLRKQAA